MIQSHARRRAHPRSHLGMRIGAGALATLLVGVTVPARAQDVTPGSRVRVTWRGSGATPVRGTLLRATGDSLWITPDGSAAATGVALGTTVRLERSLGLRRRTGTGALVGAGVGVGVTVLFLSGFCGGDTVCDGDEQVRAAAILGLPCIALGAGLGALVRTERWAPVPLGAPRPGSTVQVGLRVALPRRGGR